jgi:hypothetical protein
MVISELNRIGCGLILKLFLAAWKNYENQEKHVTTASLQARYGFETC